jgi:hypothetical protein
MQEIDDDHVGGILDEDDEVLTRPREAQILGPGSISRRFNARSTRDAILAYWRHIAAGGRMFSSMVGK